MILCSPGSVLPQNPTPVFDAGAEYRILTRYGSPTEIELADYLAAGVTGITFSLKSCDGSRADYYDSATVASGRLELTSNTLGHVHGTNTRTETVCTVTGTRTDTTAEDREFSFYTVSDRVPPGLQPDDLAATGVRATAVDVRIDTSGSASKAVRLAWRESGGRPTFRVASGVESDTTMTIPDLEPETTYEIRAYLMTSQAFDLYRAGNEGSPGTLIPEGNPDAKWISNLSGGGLGKGRSITVTTPAAEIRLVTVFYDPTSYTVAEGDTTTVTVKLSAAPGRSLTIPLTHRGTNGATSDDYGVPDPFQVTFGATETQKTFTFSAAADDVDDDGETVDLGFGTLPPGVNAGATATVTIVDDDDPVVTVFYDPTTYTVPEGSATTVTVKLSAAPERRLVIDLTHTPIGTTTTADYSGVPAAVTFGATETARTFTFVATADDVDDDGETVDLGFGTLPPGVVAGATATVTIVDDDDPEITVFYDPTAYTVAEGATTTVTVKLSAAPERELTVPLTHRGTNGATSDDYSVPDPFQVTFAAAETQKTFTFGAAADDVDDDGETVDLGFGTLPPGVNAGATATVTIVDDDDPTITVFYDPTAYTVAEGATTTVTVKLSAAPERQLTVPLTHRGTNGATSDDYSVPDPFQVTFAATGTVRTFTFVAISDDVDDSGETVDLGFGPLPPGVVAGATAGVTITDQPEPSPPPPDPPRPRPRPRTITVTVSYGSPTYTVTEGETVTVTVVLSDAPGRRVVIPLTESPGDGATRDDYSGVPASVPFGSGETVRTFVVAATDDDVDDDGETVTLGFGKLPPGVVLGTPPTAVVTIRDQPDDALGTEDVGMAETVISLTILECLSGRYAVALPSRPDGPVTVTLEVIGDGDVTVDKPWLMFTPGDWNFPQTVTVHASEDADRRDDLAIVEHTVSGAGLASIRVDDALITVIDRVCHRPPPDVPTG